MLAGIPLTLTLRIDTSAVDQEVQWPSAATIWQAYFQRSLTAAKSAKIRHRPIHTNKLQQALRKTSGLPQWQSEQLLQSETRMDRGVAEVLLPTTPVARRRRPIHLEIKPNGQRAMGLQKTVIV